MSTWNQHNVQILCKAYKKRFENKWSEYLQFALKQVCSELSSCASLINYVSCAGFYFVEMFRTRMEFWFYWDSDVYMHSKHQNTENIYPILLFIMNVRNFLLRVLKILNVKMEISQNPTMCLNFCTLMMKSKMHILFLST